MTLHSRSDDLALKVIYSIIGTVGVLDNLFVLIIFILFIKITDRVKTLCFCFTIFKSEVFPALLEQYLTLENHITACGEIMYCISVP